MLVLARLDEARWVSRQLFNSITSQVLELVEEVSKVEDELKEKIDEIIRQKAESATDELSDSEHGYVDALIWLKEGSIQLTNEGIGKEIVRRTYADPDQSTEYYYGYDSALKLVLKMLIELNATGKNV